MDRSAQIDLWLRLCSKPSSPPPRLGTCVLGSFVIGSSVLLCYPLFSWVLSPLRVLWMVSLGSCFELLACVFSSPLRRLVFAGFLRFVPVCCLLGLLSSALSVMFRTSARGALGASWLSLKFLTISANKTVQWTVLAFVILCGFLCGCPAEEEK